MSSFFATKLIISFLSNTSGPPTLRILIFELTTFLITSAISLTQIGLKTCFSIQLTKLPGRFTAFTMFFKKQSVLKS